MAHNNNIPLPLLKDESSLWWFYFLYTKSRSSSSLKLAVTAWRLD